MKHGREYFGQSVEKLQFVFSKSHCLCFFVLFLFCLSFFYTVYLYIFSCFYQFQSFLVSSAVPALIHLASWL